MPESIGYGGDTQGTEPSQYLKEKKTSVIPQVAASERGEVQTQAVQGVNRCGLGVVRPVRMLFTERREVKNLMCSGTPLGRATRVGESPVHETHEASWDGVLSTVGLEKPCGKPGGPPSKAKYASSYR